MRKAATGWTAANHVAQRHGWGMFGRTRGRFGLLPDCFGDDLARGRLEHPKLPASRFQGIQFFIREQRQALAS
jgi:hypothetical protein